MRVKATIKQIEDAARRALENMLGDGLNEIAKNFAAIKDITTLQKEKHQLREELETLQIEKGRREEEFEKKEREIEHKVGLERARQEQEIELAKREAAVTVNEGNLAAEREAFEKQMSFQQKRFEEEVKEQRTLIHEMMKRLPSAEILAQIGNLPAEKPSKK